MLKVNFKKLISVFLVAALLAMQVTFAFATEANEEYSESTESIEVHEHEHEHEEEVDESIELFDEESDEEISETEDETETEAENETEDEAEVEESEVETEAEERNEELENEEIIEENKDEETEEAETETDESEIETESYEETEEDEIEVEIVDGEICEMTKGETETETEIQTQEETEAETETETEPEPAPEEIAETVEAKKAGVGPEITWNGYPNMDPPCSEEIAVDFIPELNPITAIYLDGALYWSSGTDPSALITTTKTITFETKSDRTVQVIASDTGSYTLIRYIPQRIDHTISYNKYSHIGSKDIVAECAVCGKNCGSATLTLPTGAVVANLDPTGTRPFADPVYTSWTLSPLTIEYSNNTAVGDANDPDITKRPTYIVKDPSGGMIEKMAVAVEPSLIHLL